MFTFEKLDVYKKAKEFQRKVKNEVLSQRRLDRTYCYQLKRASLSVVLNIAEGSSRFTGPSARNFYVIARGSLFETISILDILHTEGMISKEHYDAFYEKAQDISFMLYQMIRKLKAKS